MSDSQDRMEEVGRILNSLPKKHPSDQEVARMVREGYLEEIRDEYSVTTKGQLAMALASGR